MQRFLQCIIVKAAIHGLIIEEPDVDNAELYGKITGGLIVLMKQPTDNAGIPAMPGYVCGLIRSVKGLYEAGEIRGSNVHIIIILWRFKHSNQDSRLYDCQQVNDFINLILDLDDMGHAT